MPSVVAHSPLCSDKTLVIMLLYSAHWCALDIGHEAFSLTGDHDSPTPRKVLKDLDENLGGVLFDRLMTPHVEAVSCRRLART